MRKILLLLIPLMLIFSSPVSSEILNLSKAQWWENEILTAEGKGKAPANAASLDSYRSLAKRYAMLDAYRNLAAQVSEIRITADETVLKSEVKAIISGAEIISESYDEQGNCTIKLSVPIYGVKNSVAKAVFKPVAKEFFPAPKENLPSRGNYTGLIIDCGDMELNPVLSPVIVNADNQSIYSYSNLDYEKVIEKGMIGYEKKISNGVIPLSTSREIKFVQVGSNFLAESESRAGSNPLIIKAEQLSEDNSCPVISAEDADKILSENLATHFLDEGAVVFTSNRIRGMRM